MKYIVYSGATGPGAPGLELIVIFSEIENHKDVAERLGVEPVSAGFISVHLTLGRVYCRGRSNSLDLDSRGVIDEELFAGFA